MKKTLILAVLAFPMMAAAADYPWLTFSMADGTEMSVAAEGLAINYSEGNITLKSATVDQTLATDLVKSMRFTTSAAAVEGITDLMDQEADYFDLSGKKSGRFTSSDEARKALPSGTYIVRSNDKSLKVIF
ncbi:MAG: hypothetical protein K2L00_03930 [Muribaculaceae bacterium]|nr:hypothetical protein [Muribaculaceae bacterium]